MQPTAAAPPSRAARRRSVGALTILIAASSLPVWGSAAATEPRESIMNRETRETDLDTARSLMAEFSERTGLTSDREPIRYLWTDAFAVCNYLGFARMTGDGSQRQLALRLVDQVHRTLGHHRPDDPRQGWLSGLAGDQAEEHPTRGGLRIGKTLPERGPSEPLDESLEWDRDGQYFHYLTKWMHALDLTAGATASPRYNRWARELAEVAYGAFVYTPPQGGPARMYWKMSVDLSRPLVSSMGHHDPLDGLITYRQLEARAARDADEGLRLDGEIASFAAMLGERELATTDPLGLGGLLMDADRVAQLMSQGAFADGKLLERLSLAALQGLEVAAAGASFGLPASRRLAFRELGLAIGLSAAELLAERVAVAREPGLTPESVETIQDLQPYLPLRDRIVSFWSQPQHRREPSWLDHRDINDVMLATALAPEGCLVLVTSAH